MPFIAHTLPTPAPTWQATWSPASPSPAGACITSRAWAPTPPLPSSSRGLQLLWSQASSLGKLSECFGLSPFRKPRSQHGPGRKRVSVTQLWGGKRSSPFETISETG